MVSAPDGIEVGDPRGAAPRAIERNAAQMLEPALGEYEGLPALRRFAAEVGDWPAEAHDWQWCGRFCYQVIERRGTGGGNFRHMYSRFLTEVTESGVAPVAAEAELTAEAAGRWTELAEALLVASESEQPDRGHWRGIADRAAGVLAAEERLWPALRTVSE